MPQSHEWSSSGYLLGHGKFNVQWKAGPNLDEKMEQALEGYWPKVELDHDHDWGNPRGTNLARRGTMNIPFARGQGEMRIFELYTNVSGV